MSIRPGVTEGWSHTGLLVVTLAAGERHDQPATECEWVIVPLEGRDWQVQAGEESFALHGRESVWVGATDVAFVGRGVGFAVSTATGGRVALAHAVAAQERPAVLVPADEVPVETRGAGIATREVRNFGTPAVLEADSIIACEVLTPAGNWSSYPPHKHDEDRPGVETRLEEIYYFQVRPEAGAPGEADPIAYQRVFGDDDRPIDVLHEVRTDDVVLVPHGWHGPSMAPPGYDLYYLNVMAGPGAERAWLIQDHPAHAWVRSTWPAQPTDPRVPFSVGGGG